MTHTGSDPHAEPDPAPETRNRFAWVPVAAATVLLALVAGALGVSISTPDRPGDASAEAGFSRDMSVHHAQAVEMAVTVRDNTGDTQVRTLALDIVLTQQNQIGRMQDWLIQWRLPMTGARPAMAWMAGAPGHGSGHAAATFRPGQPMPGMATAAELQRLRAARGEAAETLFLTLMIRHHRGGVAMAGAVLQRTERTDVRDLARSMVAGQQAEIGAMQRMLRDRGAPPA
jgi:uncharacterized protein (DUF305 family)